MHSVKGSWNRMMVAIGLAMVLAAWSACVSAKTSPSSAPRGPVRVRLFDVYSGLALANVEVKVTSDNGVQCELPPCPANGQTWSGRSDSAGVVIIPRSAMQVNTYVDTKDYRGARLGDEDQASSQTRDIELYPESLYSLENDWTRGYKLVDARTGKVLANIAVRIEFPNDDWPGRHGGISGLELKTNPLGYVFFSFLRKPDPKPGETLPEAPLADWMTPEASVVVPGYGKAKLNYFEGNDAERFTTRLRRQ